MPMGWPDGLTWYRLLTDWGSFIGGLLALIAGILAYIGAYQAATRQVDAARKKDQLQGRGIVLAILPELSRLTIEFNRVGKALDRWIAGRPGQSINFEPLIMDAKIDLPPMIERNIDNYFLVENGGYEVLCLVSVMLHFNVMVGKVMPESGASFSPSAERKKLAAELEAIRKILAIASDKITGVQVEAVTPPSPSAS